MDQFTPAQVKNIQTWTEQRDALLRDIGILTPQVEELKRQLKEGGLSLSDIEKQLSEVKGRLAVIEDLERRHKDSVSTEVVELEIRKSRLQGECALLEEKKSQGNELYTIVSTATKNLEEAHTIMKDQASIVNGVVGGIIETSTLHTSDMKTIMAEIRSIAAEVIEKGNKNVEQTDIILGKLPRFIFELQKPIPVRKYHESRTKFGIDREIVDEVKEINQEKT